MTTIYRTLNEKLGGRSVDEFVGNQGELFWDPSTATLRVSDGVTVGGIPLGVGLADNVGYRGFKAIVNRFWGDDGSINQLFIYQVPDGADNQTPAILAKYKGFNVDVDNDDFLLTGLREVDSFFVVNIYGKNEDDLATDINRSPIQLSALRNFAEKFIDLVIYGGADVETAELNIDLEAFDGNFYENISALKATLPELAYNFKYHQDFAGDDYTVSSTTSTSDAVLSLRGTFEVDADGVQYMKYRTDGIQDAGEGFVVGQTITILGEDILQANDDVDVFGVDGVNNAVITVEEVDETGAITDWSVTGNGRLVFPINRIGDGGDDQYDTGNYMNVIFTGGEEFNEINYSHGDTLTAGESSTTYTTVYKDSIWGTFFDNSFNELDTFFFTGETGADGDGYRQIDFVIGNDMVEFLRDVPQTRILDGDIYTLNYTDRGGHIYSYNSNILVPSNSNVAFPIGTEITIINKSDTSTVGPSDGGPDVYGSNGSGDGVTGTWELPSWSRSTLLKVETNTWILDGQGIVLD
jgi:hypothetical protein